MVSTYAIEADVTAALADIHFGGGVFSSRISAVILVVKVEAVARSNNRCVNRKAGKGVSGVGMPERLCAIEEGEGEEWQAIYEGSLLAEPCMGGGMTSKTPFKTFFVPPAHYQCTAHIFPHSMKPLINAPRYVEAPGFLAPWLVPAPMYEYRCRCSRQT